MAHDSYIQPDSSGKAIPVTSRLVVIGLVIYLISFALPAVEGGPGVGWGLLCAVEPFYPSTYRMAGVSPLIFYGGIINPMIVAYVFFWLYDAAERLRTTLSVAILICIPLTWAALAHMYMRIMVGHVAWIVGILLIISPSIPRMVRWLDPKPAGDSA